MNAVVLLSGGLDSSTLAYRLRDEGLSLFCLGFDYGQRHIRELTAAAEIARRLYSPFRVIDLTTVGKLIDSALTVPEATIPEGHYADDNMKSTVVPNRNAIMLSIAFGVAASKGARIVGSAVHAGDHTVYPDCRPGFVSSFQEMEFWSLASISEIHLVTPYLYKTKTDIVQDGTKLKVPYEVTWSCYNGRDHHCGKCGTCIERREAFRLAGVTDPTPYEPYE